MFSTWRNPKILLNSTGINCIDARVSVEAYTDPLFYSEDRGTKFYNATAGIGGVFSVSYYLTGSDPLKVFTTYERDVISGYFGGLYFRSGYLKSYTLNCIPNNPVIANADIIFYDALSGTFTKTYERATGTKVLNYCDALLVDPSNDGRAGGIGKISGINSIQFAFNSDFTPLYLAGDQIPADIRFGTKELLAIITADVYSGDLPVTGKPAGAQVKFTHPEIPGLTENFLVSGHLFKRELETSVGDILRARLYIKQAFAEALPGVTTVSDLSAAPGASITIDGTNLYTTTAVRVSDRPASFTINSNTQLTVTVPDDVISGDIEVTTQAGRVRKGLFTPTFPALTVDKLQTISGKISGTCVISGSNFYRITDVRFSTTAPGLWTGSSGFQVIDSTIIHAPIPVDTAWGPVLVMATGRGVSGQSVERFVPIPTIYGFFPPSGITGDAIIISGQGFSGVTGVLFNNLPNIEPYTATHTVTANTGIRVTVPSGNTRGPIKILARSGISVNTSTDFFSVVSLTGIVPLSGRTGTAITLLGHNMFPDLMLSLGGNAYAVTFPNNVTGIFYRTQFVNPNFTGLTGIIPYNAKSGFVAINYTNDAKYPSNVVFKLINEPPTITGVTPKSGAHSGYVNILGTNFYNVSAVKLSGLGRTVTVSNPDPVTSALADVISIRIPKLTPHLTGDIYTVIVETTIGANVTGNALFTILDNPIFSGFTGVLLGTSGAFGDRVVVTGKYIYPGSRIYVPFTGLSGESGEAVVDSGSFNSTNSQVAFYVPQTARTGLSNIILYNGVGYASGTDFKLINRPRFTGFAPTSGEWGTGISLFSGVFLSNVTGVTVGTGIQATFTVVTDTGITMTIPEDSDSDYVTVHSRAGSYTSTGKLSIYIPLPTFSGFVPTRAYTGEQLIFSGSRLHTIDAVIFSGGSEQVLFDYRYFTKVGSTGITMNVPPGITSGQITLRAPRGRVTSSQFFEPAGVPSISGLSSAFGAHNEVISVTGSNLSGMYIWFVSPVSGKFVSGLSQSWVGHTGITVTVPREITIGPLLVSGSGRRWSSSSQTFVPLPTISGFTPTGVQSGNTLTITGINATRCINSILFMTGNHKFWNAMSGVFTFDFTNASGSHISNPTSGYTLLTCALDSEIIDTGRLFLISDFFSGAITNTATFLTSQISGKVSNIISTDTLYVQETSPVI